MGDDYHRQTLFGEVAHDFEHFADHLGVECARRLVEQQNLGLHRKRAGYCDALEEAGITPNPENLITNLFPFKAERGIALGRQLAAQRAITGVCVSGDQYAAAVITGLREGGARVPEDISIVGFDDVDIARMTFPPLTTIHQDGIGKGRRAAEAIFAMIDGEHPDPKDFNLPVKLIVRGSTGPARIG